MIPIESQYAYMQLPTGEYTNLCPILDHFRAFGVYMSNYYFSQAGLKKLEMSLYCVVHNIFQYSEPFPRGSPVWQTDRQMDRTTTAEIYRQYMLFLFNALARGGPLQMCWWPKYCQKL